MFRVLANLNFGAIARILNLPLPVAPEEPATKGYVDAVVEGLAWKSKARVASNIDVVLSAAVTTVDGVAVTTGDRVLLVAQADPAQNGIYQVDAGGFLVRTADGSTAAELTQAVIAVAEGSLAGSAYRQFNLLTDLNSAQAWSVFGGNTVFASQVEVNTGADASKAVSSSTLAGSVFASKGAEATLVGDGTSTAFTITHGLGVTRLIQVSVIDNATTEDVLVDITRPSDSTVVVTFAVAPAAGVEYRALLSTHNYTTASVTAA